MFPQHTLCLNNHSLFSVWIALLYNFLNLIFYSFFFFRPHGIAQDIHSLTRD